MLWCASGPGLDIIQLLLLKLLHDYTFLGPKILKIKPKKTQHLKLQLPHQVESRVNKMSCRCNLNLNNKFIKTLTHRRQKIQACRSYKIRLSPPYIFIIILFIYLFIIFKVKNISCALNLIKRPPEKRRSNRYPFLSSC